MGDKVPYKLYIISDVKPLYKFVTIIAEETDLPKEVTDTATISHMVIKFDVPCFNDVLNYYKMLLDYLTSTDWYFDDDKISLCDIGCQIWDDTFNEYVDYVNDEGEEFRDIVERWIEEQKVYKEF